MSKTPPTSSTPPAESLRISDLVDRTELSKELIHHYLRLGLIPRPEERGHYTGEHVRLLALVKRMREDFHLPLEVIRQLFGLFAFDADRMDPLVQVESVAQRLTRLATNTDLGLSDLLSADDVVARAGVDVATLERFVDGGVVVPVPGESPSKFTEYDVHAVALCERGTRMGIPFESFRTVASYVQVAFELAHREFIDVGWKSNVPAEQMLGEVFVRREIVSSFVHSVLQAQLTGRLRQSLAQRSSGRTVLDDVVYRPSADFLARHGLNRLMTHHKTRLSEEPEDETRWRRTAELLMHAGSYREAAFFFEQAMEKWPSTALKGRLGIALVLGGDPEKGRALLQAVHDTEDATPESTIYLALSRFFLPGGDPTAQSTEDATAVLDMVEQALASANRGVVAIHVRLFGGWLLTALPPTFRRLERGHRILVDLFEELGGGAVTQSVFPGLRERSLLNASWLLFESLARTGAMPSHTAPSAEELRALICRLDPSSEFARQVFLEADS
jgi:DNA-binding transcriptional MerR regulator